MTLTEWAALVGAITGPLGLMVGVLVYFRDRARVVVDVTWGMKAFGPGPYDPNKEYGCVTVVNIGRRPIFLSHVHLLLPEKAAGEFNHFVLSEGIQGRTFAEGDEPAKYWIDQSLLAEYSPLWHKMRAAAIGSAGRNHKSDWLISKPPWAEDAPDYPAAVFWNKVRNRLRRLLP